MGGTISVVVLENVNLSNPGVRIVRLGCFRRLFLSGPFKGEEGADSGCNVVSCPDEGDMEGLNEIVLVVLKDKFFVLRSLLPGDSGREDSGGVGSNFGNGASGIRSSTECDRRSDIMDLKGASGANEVGDSGEELGEGSVTEAESSVEIVVVGDESVDSELADAILPRCRKGGGSEPWLSTAFKFTGSDMLPCWV